MITDEFFRSSYRRAAMPFCCAMPKATSVSGTVRPNAFSAIRNPKLSGSRSISLFPNVCAAGTGRVPEHDAHRNVEIRGR